MAGLGLAQVFAEDDCSILKFSEQELNELLGIMGSGLEPTALPRPASFPDLAGNGMPRVSSATMLQFQPHSPEEFSEPTSLENNNCADPGGSLAFNPQSGADQSQHVARILSGESNVMTAPAATAASAAAASFASMAVSAPAFPGFPMQQQPQQQQAQRQHSVQEQSSSRSEKPQVSHSSVEKQRRDRINSLIDELRDLVPPQKGANAPSGGKFESAAAAEARRPKHQVLADTIALLKQFKINAQGFSSMGQPGSMPATVSHAHVKEEPDRMRMDEMRHADSSEAPPLLPMPNIPSSLGSFAGVTVEKAPDTGVMYVQVKCRDRRGLLSDIINALKQLPLEIRTAAVVTCGDGMVRDVFEIQGDDPNLRPDEIQNAVHDALYHQEAYGKKHKSHN